jgi:hypothetical protein
VKIVLKRIMMTTFEDTFRNMDKQNLTPTAPKKKFSISTIEIAGYVSALMALRLPFGLGCRSIGSVAEKHSISEQGGHIEISSVMDIEPKDLHLLSTLVKRGDEHAKVLRAVMVYAQIDAPIWFYRELETYRIGRERLSCESTMHIECKGLGGAELEKAKDEIPMGHIQRTIDVYSYQTLRRIYFQRRNHRLPMWREFCSWIETLPFADELILIQKDNGSNESM